MQGVSAYLLKLAAGEELVAAIHEVMQGRSYLTPLIARDLLSVLIEAQRGTTEEGPKLTLRQRDSATDCGRQNGEGDCRRAEYFKPNRRRPQIRDHAGFRRQDDRRACSTGDSTEAGAMTSLKTG